MNNKICCSTGCIIEKSNGYDWRLILKYADQIDADAFELMMLRAFYGHEREISDSLCRAGIEFPILHTDKDVGTLISRGGNGDLDEAVRLFSANCDFAAMLGAKLLVLHLWGGLDSDKHFERNTAAFPILLEAAEKRSLTIAVENVPCASAADPSFDPKTANPLSHWDALEKLYPEARFIFDTRFGAFHRQLDEFCGSKRIESGKVVHMHVSDFSGPPLDFSTLRPILHPHEGIIDFEKFFASVVGRYDGTVTLESPVLASSGFVDIGKLNGTLGFLRDSLQRKV